MIKHRTVIQYNDMIKHRTVVQYNDMIKRRTVEQVNVQSDDDEVHFVLDQHAELEIYSASSLKQQSAGRHVAPLRHIIPIPSQPVFVLTP
jgi:hypothetical protein